MARRPAENLATGAAGFAGLPLAEQIASLQRELKTGREDELLQQCAALTDTDPLAWLCRALAERGYLEDTRARD